MAAIDSILPLSSTDQQANAMYKDGNDDEMLGAMRFCSCLPRS